MTLNKKSAPITSSTDGKIVWAQGEGIMKIDTYTKAVTPSSEGGSPADIQVAIDSLSDTGGIVVIRNGTYLLEDDIVVPTNITLRGETAGGTILDFQSGAHQVIASGTLVYNTGTVAINTGSDTVTGTGTTWTSDMVDSYINLYGIWYLIVDVASTTSLTIESLFEPLSITGQSYSIADPLTNVAIENLTVQNSTHSNGGVFFQYVFDIVCQGLNVFDSTIGLNFKDAWAVTVRRFLVLGCTTGVNVDNANTWTFNDFEVYGSVGDNMVLNKLRNASVSNFTQSVAGANALTITNSTNWAIYDFAIISSTAKGIELSSSNDIMIANGNVQSSGSDGIKLTINTDRVGITNTTLRSNTGYGINVAAATDDKNTLNSCFFLSNTAGTVNNAGTGTISVNHQT